MGQHTWRKVVVYGKTYRWRGRTHIVIQDPEGYRISDPDLNIATLKGLDWNTVERGRWKGTPDGMIRPAHIVEYIKKKVGKP